MKQTSKILFLVLTVLIMVVTPTIQTKAMSNCKQSQEKEEDGVVDLIKVGETQVVGGKIDPAMVDQIKFNKKGYINDITRLRHKPSKKSRLHTRLTLNSKIMYANYNKKYKIVKGSKNRVFFINSKFISKKPIKTTLYSVSGDRCKTYESYTAIGTKGRSIQSKLQAQAQTRKDGVRTVKDRVCIAIGSHYKANIGQYVDVHLKNGTIIECVVSDWKANQHTVNNHTLGLHHDAIEVIVDVKTLKKNSKVSGDMSDLCKAWDSKVTKIVKYDKNYFD